MLLDLRCPEVHSILRHLKTHPNHYSVNQRYCLLSWAIERIRAQVNNCSSEVRNKSKARRFGTQSRRPCKTEPQSAAFPERASENGTEKQ